MDLTRPSRPGSGLGDRISRLAAIMARLRDPETGCPWDVQQDFASIAPYTIDQRKNGISASVMLRFNEYFQSVRRAMGADMSYFLLNEMDVSTGQTYYMVSTVAYEDRGVVVIKPGFAAHPNQCGASRNRTVFAHELSHINGGSHNRAVHPNGNGTYAYHNGEPYHRRNEAYGFPVSQHDKVVYTLTSYPKYRPGPNNDGISCIECTRIPVLSSPDLWWFFRTNDPLSGHCLALEETLAGHIRLACQALQPYVLSDGTYLLDESKVVELSPADLINRAIPLGVDEPSFIHPETGELISDPTSSRVRDVVLSTWPKRAHAAKPIDPSCGLDCAEQNRVSCGFGESTCGPCLPGTTEFDGACYGRREANAIDPIHDERYEATGLYSAPLGSVIVDVPLIEPSDIARVELYLGTVDETGSSNDTWALGAGFTFGVPPAPMHTFTVSGVRANGDIVFLGSDLSPDAVANDSASQTNHALTYLLALEDWVPNVTSIRIELQSESTQYGMSLLEARTFGRPSAP